MARDSGVYHGTERTCQEPVGLGAQDTRCHPSVGQGRPCAGLRGGSLSAKQEPVLIFVLSQVLLLQQEVGGCNTGTGSSPVKLGTCWCRWGAGLSPQLCPLPAGSLLLLILIWFCQDQLQTFTKSRSALPASEPWR